MINLIRKLYELVVEIRDGARFCRKSPYLYCLFLYPMCSPCIYCGREEEEEVLNNANEANDESD